MPDIVKIEKEWDGAGDLADAGVFSAFPVWLERALLNQRISFLIGPFIDATTREKIADTAWMVMPAPGDIEGQPAFVGDFLTNEDGELGTTCPSLQKEGLQ